MDNGAGPADPDGFDDAKLQALLRELVEASLDLLEPEYAEVVRRADILEQLPSEIAREMGLSTHVVTKRLLAGRRAISNLIALTVWPFFQE